MTHIRLHVSKHAVPVIPDTEEAEHMAVHLEELLETVVGGWRGVGVGGEVARLGVRVTRSHLGGSQLNALTHHEVLGNVMHKDVTCNTCEQYSLQ